MCWHRSAASASNLPALSSFEASFLTLSFPPVVFVSRLLSSSLSGFGTVAQTGLASSSPATAPSHTSACQSLTLSLAPSPSRVLTNATPSP